MSSRSYSNGATAPAPTPDKVLLGATLSEVVYGDSDAPALPPGWHVLDRYPESGQSDWGFAGEAFQAPDGQIVIAFRGTEFTDLMDLSADFDLVGGRPGTIPAPSYVPPELHSPGDDYDGPNAADAYAAEAMAFTRHVMEAHPDAPVSVTGHSLGGWAAQVVAAQTGLPGHAFNAPGAKGYIERIGADGSGDSFYNHNSKGDPVSEVGVPYGESHTYPVECNPLKPWQHHTIRPLQQALAHGARPLDAHGSPAAPSRETTHDLSRLLDRIRGGVVQLQKNVGG